MCVCVCRVKEYERFKISLSLSHSLKFISNEGFPKCEADPRTGRTDYFGPMVNKSAR